MLAEGSGDERTAPLPSAPSEADASDGEPRARSLVSGLVGLALLATGLAFARGHGVLASDGHFVFFANPPAEFAAYRELWSRNVDLGGVLPTFAPVPYAFVSALHAAGLAPWLIQRIWFAALLFAAAAGTALFTRVLAPGSQLAPFVAGVAMMVSPFTTGFFLPTWLYVNAATLPWLCLFVWNGTTTVHRWRAAALFASVAVLGSAWNPPGALWAAMSLAPLVAYALASGRATWRSTWGFAWRSASLLGLLLPVIVLRLLHASSTLEDNLASSESAAAVSRSSSWSETLRGLGSWRLYWNPRGPLNLRYAEPFLTNWPVVVASFAGIVVATTALVRLRGGARLMLATMMLLAAMVMVGGYPLANQSPLGRLLFSLYDASPAAFSLRSVYKAGAGLVLATSVLIGLGAAALFARTRRSTVRALWAVTLAGLGLLCAMPWLDGSLVTGRDSLRTAIPVHWTEAAHWLNDQPSDAAALVVPATSTWRYRWGSAPNGDIFPSLVDRPVMMARPLSLTPTVQYSTIQAMSDAVTTGRYRHGTLAPMARRLGVRYVVVRNDLEWRTSGLPRPSQLDSLRTDPDLSLVATFGDPGENTVDADDESIEASADAQLPPVEIYEVRDANEPVRVESASPSVVLSGDGSGWAALARRGDLDGTGPIEYAAAMTTDALTRAVRSGSPVVITDSNRRRSAAWGTSPVTLRADEGERIDDVFGVAGSQTTVAFGDAAAIEEIGTRGIVRSTAAHRPSAAFDGITSTSWLTGLFADPGQEALDVRFTRPRTVRSVTVEVARVPEGRRVTAIAVHLGDVTELASVVGGVATVEVEPVEVASVRVQVTGVAGSGPGPYGFAEVRIDDLDLRERVVVADQVARAATNDDALDAALSTAAVSYSFSRQLEAFGDVEPLLARRFDTVAPIRSRVRARIGADRWSTDERLSRLLQLPMTVSVTSRLHGSPAHGGIRAVDGDVSTAWTPSSSGTSTLQLVADEVRRVRRVRLDFDLSPGRVLPQRVVVRTGRDRISRLVDTGDCRMRADRCRMTFAFERPRKVASVAVDVVRPNAPEPVSLAEVRLSRRPNPRLELSDECRSDLLRIDDERVPVRLTGTAVGLLDGETVQVESCADVQLGAGWHELFTVPHSLIDDLVVGDTPRTAAAVAPEPLPTVVTRDDATSYRVAVGPHGSDAVLFLGQADDGAWTATTPGVDLGGAVLRDGQATWTISAADRPLVIDVSYAPQRLYRWLSALMALGFMVAIVLAVWDPRRATPWRVVDRRRTAAPLVDLVAVVACYAIGGIVGIVVAVVLLVVVRRRWWSPRAIGGIAVLLLCLAVLATLPGLGPSLTPADPLWPARRDLAHQSAKVAALVLWVAVAGWVRLGDGPPNRRATRRRAARSDGLDDIADDITGASTGDRSADTNVGVPTVSPLGDPVSSGAASSSSGTGA